MQVEILQNGRVLQRIQHNGQDYIEAPPSGTYEIRLTNNCPHRRLAVVTVDGVNINDGKDGSYDGSGYAMAPWQTFTLAGWLRSDSKVAAFDFKASEGSYAAQTGRGTKNVGVIGVAVFDEKPKPVITLLVVQEHHHHHHHDHFPLPWTYTLTSNSGPTMDTATYSSNSINGVSEIGEVQCSASAGTYEAQGAATMFSAAIPPAASAVEPLLDVGTGYGREMTQYTSVVEFVRATSMPNLVVTLRYAVRARLREWGVPIPERVTHTAPAAPNPFPAAPGYVQPPAGWVR